MTPFFHKKRGDGSEFPEDTAETAPAAVKGAALPKKAAATPAAAEKTVPVPDKKRGVRLFVRRKSPYPDPNDPRIFTGPLSYRTLRVVAFSFMIIGQIATILSLPLIRKYFQNTPETLNTLTAISALIGALALPLFLLAAFSTILNVNEVKKKLVLYGCSAVGFFFAMEFVFHHYLIGFEQLIHSGSSPEEVYIRAETLFETIFKQFSNYNVFVDLFLFSSICFFLVYKPKKLAPEKLKWFRALVLIPILFVLATSVLYVLDNKGTIDLPIILFSAMPCRTTTVYYDFAALLFYVLLKRRNFLKSGKTEEEFAEYTLSREYARGFSRTAAAIFVLVGVLDLAIGLLFPNNNYGIGSSCLQILVAPIILLFSCNIRYENKTFDTILPIIAIAVIVLLYVEAMFQSVVNLPNLPV